MHDHEIMDAPCYQILDSISVVLGICDTVHIEYHVSLQLNCSIQYCITVPNTNSMKLIMIIDYIYSQALHALINHYLLQMYTNVLNI